MQLFGSAVILAGGRSTRMGFDKQLLQSGGRTITDELIAELKTCFSDVLISSSRPELYEGRDVRVVQDVFEGCGPLAGIHAALLQARSQWVFVTACDMPYLEPAYIDYMMGRLRDRLSADAYEVCATEREGRLEPFHAFYGRAALPLLENRLEQGLCSVTRFVREAKALIIPEGEAESFLPGWRAFLNLNTPEEYERYRR